MRAPTHHQIARAVSGALSVSIDDMISPTTDRDRRARIIAWLIARQLRPGCTVAELSARWDVPETRVAADLGRVGVVLESHASRIAATILRWHGARANHPAVDP